MIDLACLSCNCTKSYKQSLQSCADREAWVSPFTDVLLLHQVRSKELPYNCCKQSHLFQVNFTKEHLTMLSNTVKQVLPKIMGVRYH